MCTTEMASGKTESKGFKGKKPFRSVSQAHGIFPQELEAVGSGAQPTESFLSATAEQERCEARDPGQVPSSAL